MNRSTVFPIRLGVLVASAATALAAPFAPGNLVVARVGDGSAALTSAATPVFLDEYTTSGTLVQSIALPTTASGQNRALTNSGTATSEAFLTVSADARYLILAGYNALPGTVNVSSSSTTTINRIVGRVDMSGSVDTSTFFDGLSYSGGNIRSAASDDGTRFWTAGTASTAANGGCWLVPLGTSSAPSQISETGTGTLTNMRVVNVFAGQLYVSSAAGTFHGVSTVGSGLPTTGDQTVTLLSGFPIVAGPSSYDYFLADAGTLYVADDRGIASGGGIQKWTLSAGTWSLAYTLNTNLTGSGCRGLTGVVNGAGTTLYATAASANSNNNVVTVTDTGPASTFATITTAGMNVAARGIRLVPDTGCTAPSITADPANVSVIECDTALFSVAAIGTGPLAYQWRRNSGDLTDGGRISGTTTSTLTVADIETSDVGTYDCIVSNACGSATSNSATLSVTPCPGDVNCDHRIDLSDLTTLLSQFGSGDGTFSADLDGDGDVDLGDLTLLLSQFGTVC